MENKYPTPYELTEVLSKITNSKFLSSFAQSKGLFFTNIKWKEFAKELSYIYLDREDLEAIRHAAYNESEKHMLSGFTIKSDSRDFNLKAMYETMIEKENPHTELHSYNSLVQENTSTDTQDVFKGTIEYNQIRPGRIEFLQNEKSVFDFTLNKINEREWQVEVDANKSADAKALKNFFEKMLPTEQIFIDEIDSTNLNTANGIIFLDRLGHEGLGQDWNLEDISHVSLKRAIRNKDAEIQNVDINTDIDESENNEVEVNEEQILDIKQAVLEGQNLRENNFVKDCETKGYRFTAMTYKLAHKTDPFNVKIRAEFKERPRVFEVSIIEFTQTEGITLTKKSANSEKYSELYFRSMFWNNAKKVYNSIVK